MLLCGYFVAVAACLVSVVPANTIEIVTKWDKTNIHRLANHCISTSDQRIIIEGFKFSGYPLIDFGSSCQGSVIDADCKEVFDAINACRSQKIEALVDVEIRDFEYVDQVYDVFCLDMSRASFSFDGFILRTLPIWPGLPHDPLAGTVVGADLSSRANRETIFGYEAYVSDGYFFRDADNYLVDLTSLEADSVDQGIKTFELMKAGKEANDIFGYVVKG